MLSGELRVLVSSGEERTIAVETPDYVGPATERRDALGVLPSFYWFGTRVHQTLPGEEEPSSERGTDLDRVGWRGIAGADLFFSQRWGIAIEYAYDWVWRLYPEDNGQFHGVSIGVAYQMPHAPRVSL